MCGQISAEGICPDCHKKIVAVTEGAYCMHCGKPLRDEAEEYCPDCRRQMAGGGSSLDRGRSLWLHREPVSGAVYRFKYKTGDDSARYLRRNWRTAMAG